MPVRLRNAEVLLLELAAYLATQVALDGDDATDHALVTAYEEFRKSLEETL